MQLFSFIYLPIHEQIKALYYYAIPVINFAFYLMRSFIGTKGDELYSQLSFKNCTHHYNIKCSVYLNLFIIFYI